MTIHDSRRRFMLNTLRYGAGISMLGLGARAAWAQPQPRIDTLKIICGYPPGGALDIIARRLAERVTGRLARVAVVENRTGAAGRIAVDALKASPADGSTILFTPASIVTHYPHIYRSLSYDIFTDLAPVSTVAVTAFALVVGPSVPASVRTFGDFVGWCKANPGAASCGNPGAGSFPHFMAMLVARETGIPLIHTPFRGGQPAMLAAAGGHVAAALSTENAALALEQGGKLRVIATTGAERSAIFPNVPTFAELGYRALAQREWFGAFMPARTPPAMVEAASAAIRTALAESEIREAWHKLGLAAQSSTPAVLQQTVRTDYDFWGPIIRASGFTPEA
jgi:tripartite-type tricarboxylate transporter receptor subunit TctC